MKYISRHMENRILELSKSYSAILLTGPRQAGKTTMLRELAEKENIGRRYVTLDNLSERDLAKNDPALFLQLHKPPVLIDEVQYAPELFTYIKIHIDEHHKPGDFWMTGSQIFRLMLCRNLWQDVWRCCTCLPCRSVRSSGHPVFRLPRIWNGCSTSEIRLLRSPRLSCSSACGAAPCQDLSAVRHQIGMSSIRPTSPPT